MPKTLYLDCSTGISGDMTLGALIDLGVDLDVLRRGIDSLGLPGVTLHVNEVIKGGFRAQHIRIEHPEQHAHRHYSDIVALLDQASALTDRQRDLAKRIFLAVAQAESRVHGSTLEQIHFHEVGAIDSIVDIVGAAIGFDLLDADEIVCSPLPTGRGQIRIDHGICTVPAPGTAELLKGIPLVDVPIEAELTTPTGAAIVKTLADRFGPLPAMTIERVGYGAGTMTFPLRANVLRMFLGTSHRADADEEVLLLETNLDDVTGEVLGYVKQLLLATGALDAYTTAIQMKKDRPAVVLSVLCTEERRAALEEIIYRETETLGIRRQRLVRSTRARQPHTVLTSFGPVLGKVAWQASGVPTFSPEFAACADLAQATGCSLREVYRAAESAFVTQQPECQPERPVSGPSAATSQDHGHSHDHDHGHSHDHDHGHSHDHDHGH
ncbi:MAG: nickel pincer cofactor biosynthesis protein LarC [Planctomycetaceae bacterium]|nr:nickel pincer cofactor biosynthesis protein LarC [Planctomycetaceae bacterium]